MKTLSEIRKQVKKPVLDPVDDMPSVLILKRKSIRQFPDGQKVALYWSDRLEKYISVPFSSINISGEE